MRRLSLALAALLSACGSEASVGDASCTDAELCPEIEVAGPLSLSVLSTRDLPERTATWLRSTAELGVGTNAQLLASAPSGGLWLFTSAGQELIAKRLDFEGKLLGEQRHAPPTDLNIAGADPAWWSPPVDHGLGPVVVGQWLPECPQPGSTQRVLCPRSEIFVFGNDTSTAPQRIGASAGLPAAITGAYRSLRGDALYLPLADKISMLDLQGRTLWARDLPRGVTLSLASATSRGGLLEGGGLVLSATGPTNPALLTLGQLLVQPPNGEPPFLQSYLATLASSADSYRASPSSESALSVDASGRRMMVVPVEGGDMVVVRADSQRAEGWRIRREDYRDLWLNETTSDTAGTTYVTGSSGTRDASSAFLCRFPREGAAACWRTPYLQSVRSPTPGVLFATSTEDLLRYDF